MKDYHINIFYSDADGGYIADVLALVFILVISQRKKALKQVQIAKKTWIEAARHEGRPIPKPKYRPAIYQSAS